MRIPYRFEELAYKIYKRLIKRRRVWKMKLKRPRCDYCGNKIYPKNKPFMRNSFFSGEIPSFCPDCGKEISYAKKTQLEEYNTKIYFICCLYFIIVFIAFVVITLITATLLQNA
jgi:uncharacterized protein with PIN domain